MASALSVITHELENQRAKLSALESDHRPTLEQAESARAEIAAQTDHVDDLARSLRALEDAQLKIADAAADEAAEPDSWLERNRVALAEETSKPWRPPVTVEPLSSFDFGTFPNPRHERVFSDPIRLPLGQVDRLVESSIAPAKLHLVLTATGVALLRAGYAVCITEHGDVYDARGLPPQAARA